MWIEREFKYMTVFKTKYPKKMTQKILNWFSIKFLKRTSIYYFLRLTRLEASIYSISAGFACGSMVSFTPFLGFHFFMAVIIAFIIRGNLIASLIGTAIGNPFTFPLIWLFIYRIGNLFITENHVNKNIDFNFENIVNSSFDIFLPMLIGAAVISLPVWFISYFFVRLLIINFKRKK